MQTETYTLPAHWASYLINGDASGLEDSEQEQVDAWRDYHPELSACVDCTQEPEFRHSNDADFLGGDTLKYTFILR